MGWEPDCYQKEEIEELADMPETLKEMIKKLPATVSLKKWSHFQIECIHLVLITLQEANSNIWVSCSTATDGDHNITVNYDGHFGFPKYYFPYENQKGYLPPFVALQLSNMPGRNNNSRNNEFPQDFIMSSSQMTWRWGWAVVCGPRTLSWIASVAWAWPPSKWCPRLKRRIPISVGHKFPP